MDKREIYRDIIVSNSTSPDRFTNEVPKGYKVIDTKPSASCSDDFTLYIKLSGPSIEDILFSGSGCSISTSSINILANMLIGKSVKEANTILAEHNKLITTGKGDYKILGDLIAFEGVSKFNNRIECALLGANALKEVANG